MKSLFLRDIKLAFRSGGGFGLTLAFFLIVILFVPLGVGADNAVLARIAPGILWIGAILSCLLSLDRIFQLDFEDGTLEALATSPLPLEAITASKAAAHWITTGLPLTIIAPILAYLLKLPSEGYFWLLTSLMFGTPALSFVGTFAAAVTVGVKRGGLLLSLLVLPLYIPSLIFGAQTIIRATIALNPMPALLMTTGISLFCIALMPFASALALRVNLK
ncbi:UNVERIFIED_CONTAM: hypothetical protein GTU68_052281 [Idotea baltica]|nr:hypothetical protein [Idotea baltica]